MRKAHNDSQRKKGNTTDLVSEILDDDIDYDDDLPLCEPGGMNRNAASAAHTARPMEAGQSRLSLLKHHLKELRDNDVFTDPDEVSFLLVTERVNEGLAAADHFSEKEVRGIMQSGQVNDIVHREFIAGMGVRWSKKP